MDLINGKLRLYVKRPDTFDVVAKKLNPVRQIVRKGEDIHNTPADRKLSGLVDKIYPFEVIFIQKFVNKIDAEHGLLGNMQGVFLQITPVDDFLSNRIGISDNNIRQFRGLVWRNE